MSIVLRATKRPRGDAHGYHHASHYNCSHCSARRRRLVRPGTLVLSNGKVPRRSERSSSSYDRTRETRPAGTSAWSASVTSKSLVTSRPIVHQSQLVNHRSFSSLPYPGSIAWAFGNKHYENAKLKLTAWTVCTKMSNVRVS